MAISLTGACWDTCFDRHPKNWQQSGRTSNRNDRRSSFLFIEHDCLFKTAHSSFRKNINYTPGKLLRDPNGATVFHANISELTRHVFLGREEAVFLKHHNYISRSEGFQIISESYRERVRYPNKSIIDEYSWVLGWSQKVRGQDHNLLKPVIYSAINFFVLLIPQLCRISQTLKLVKLPVQVFIAALTRGQKWNSAKGETSSASITDLISEFQVVFVKVRIRSFLNNLVYQSRGGHSYVTPGTSGKKGGIQNGFFETVVYICCVSQLLIPSNHQDSSDVLPVFSLGPILFNTS
uniref:Ovule protein n=1 Tax=Heterorhabditis bacteriophora TaxID=37862 RepID=A0A1I7W6B7_HETBA